MTNETPKTEALRDLWERAANERTALKQAARALIREIEKRDGEGNVIPAHLYSRLAALVREES